MRDPLEFWPQPDDPSEMNRPSGISVFIATLVGVLAFIALVFWLVG